MTAARQKRKKVSVPELKLLQGIIDAPAVNKTGRNLILKLGTINFSAPVM